MRKIGLAVSIAEVDALRLLLRHIDGVPVPLTMYPTMIGLANGLTNAKEALEKPEEPAPEPEPVAEVEPPASARTLEDALSEGDYDHMLEGLMVDAVRDGDKAACQFIQARMAALKAEASA